MPYTAVLQCVATCSFCIVTACHKCCTLLKAGKMCVGAPNTAATLGVIAIGQQR